MKDHAINHSKFRKHVDIMNRMATLELNLPERLKATAQARAVAAGYGSVDHYIASLIEADEIAPISDATEAALLQGLASGPAVEITPQFIADLRERTRRGT